MKKIVAALLVSTAVLGAGCTQVQYGDAQAVETVNADFGSTDLQMTAEKMVDSMLSFPPIVQVTAQKRPVMYFDRIKNKTTEHIDTESVSDTIQTKLLQSGKFRLTDMSKVEELQRQLDYQNKSGMVDDATSAKIGRQIGAEYMLYGNLSSIVKRDGSTKDVYYKFTMKLMHIESGMIEWQDEKEIRKTQKKSLFGM